ncbi:hypothetical protein MTR67_039100 [Solanum verrucosum]|uniref:Uncharacterized protein n=1 Tax=Solanum verrucosum TaxID=315347 RepID=A0AAF0UGC0_SOLVR|nr:hypothetical protein MTR67_039100 [Solanum verrucosum]
MEFMLSYTLITRVCNISLSKRT